MKVYFDYPICIIFVRQFLWKKWPYMHLGNYIASVSTEFLSIYSIKKIYKSFNLKIFWTNYNHKKKNYHEKNILIKVKFQFWTKI